MQTVLLLTLLANPVWKWLHRIGAPGLILLGLVDNSVVPLPGSMDAAVILLSAHRREWWPYYGFMATIGAVLGGYLTYRLAKKGGQATLEKKFGKKRAEKVYSRFEEHGFVTVFVGAILPPPFPVVPFLMAAGALEYPWKKFIAALSAGRVVRFFAVAYVSHVYGKQFIGWLSGYYKPVLYALIALGVVAGIGALIYFKWYRPRVQNMECAEGSPVEPFPLPGHHPRAKSHK